MITSKPSLTALALGIALVLGGCGKKPAPAAEAPVAAPVASPVAVPVVAAPAPASAPEPAEDTPEASERAEKQAKLDYASMEDGYINDVRAQWAAAAKASSSFGEVGDKVPKTPQESGAWKSTGKVDGDTWLNNEQNIGFDWLELAYDKPVTATEVRVVGDDHAAESISKLELIDVDGRAHTVWSGLSDVKRDQRGPRTWFVKKFDAIPFKVKSVKLTVANNVSSGYKHIDAVQLVGD